VNLAAAVARMGRVAAATAGDSAWERVTALELEAAAIANEDREACARLGRLGADWLRRLWASRRPPAGAATLLTHCNAGALATAGIGTALGIIRMLAADGAVAVLADETRPFLQGARLTAWELTRDGVPVTLLPDVAAAGAIASGRVDAVIVGADRIARNGDVANKTGTYGLALACRANGIPFLVAAPTTTLDPDSADGAAIPIEMRESEEVLLIPTPKGEAIRIAPEGVSALYPAFDVTPALLVDAIVTERGISTPPHAEGLKALLP
jgi:methylthioribose-1-phosphate isomerase